ncbi:MAG: hypothetical protein FWD66_04440 [Paludibacter sp.]|nr:hypothetical protein [Paludibacter sp.]
MKKIIIIFFTVCISNVSFSQVGYMGKRFLINADAWVSPSWFVPNSKGDKGFSKFNYFLEPGIEFIFSKQMAVGTTYLLFPQRKFPVGIYAAGYVEFPYSTYIVKNSFYINQNIYDNTLNTQGVGLYFKYYLGKFAPLGYFIKTEFDYFFYKYTINEVNLNQYMELPQGYEDYSKVIYSAQIGNGSVGGFKVEIGRDFLLFNKVRLSTGIGVGVTLGGFKANPFKKQTKYVFDFNDLEENQSDMITTSESINGQLLGMYWFGLRMGIGFLTF